MVNLLFSSIDWTRPRNAAGVRHHVFDMYTRAFASASFRVYPTRSSGNWLTQTVYHAFRIGPSSVNVVAPGFPVLSAYLAQRVVRGAKVVVHTWKVPGYTSRRWTARAYDCVLDDLIRKAVLVVVASRKQLAQMSERYPGVPVLFAPVTVDCQFWCPDAGRGEDAHRLSTLGVDRDGFVLTVGDSDRDEALGVEIAARLARCYVRVTKDKRQVRMLRQAEEAVRSGERAKVLLDVSDEDLRALYRAAYVVSLPTLTRTNPAGLSALTEAMACGALVLAPEELCNGYIVDQVSGVTFNVWDAGKVSRKMLQITPDRLEAIRTEARRMAMVELSSERVAANLRQVLHEALNR